MESRKISINDMPKGFKIFALLLPVLGLILIDKELDNDFYFLYPTGQYIVENGFPVKDFLSMHTNMNIIVQQWLTDVIFYYIYSALGKAGMIAFIIICYVAFCAVMYKLMMLICENHFVSCVAALSADLIMATMFMVTRPQAITLVLITLELYCLEKYVKTKSVKPLFVLPLISLLIINLHCSMWFMLFVFALPYVASAIPVKIKKLKLEPSCRLLPLLICGAVCLAFGFINPYGIKAITYIFSSFGISDINLFISEMQAPSMGNSVGKLFFAIVFILVTIIIVLRKNNFTTRFVLLFLGTTALGLMNVKSIAYFVIGSFVAITYYLKDFSFSLNITEGKRTKKEKRNFIIIVSVFVIAIAGLCSYAVITPDDNTVNNNSDNSFSYMDLDNICKILDKEDGKITLYTGFNFGQYMEYKGYHPYIDGRAELFLKKNNGEFDYFKEYVDVKNGEIYYKDFFNKYQFNYAVIDKNSEVLLSSELSHDENYEKLYESESVDLYRLKN